MGGFPLINLTHRSLFPVTSIASFYFFLAHFGLRRAMRCKCSIVSSYHANGAHLTSGLSNFRVRSNHITLLHPYDT